MFRTTLFIATAFLIHTGLAGAFADQPIPEAVRDTASRLIPDFSESQVKPSPVTGLYEITFGPRLLYMSADGKFVIQGDIIDIARGENVSETTRKRVRVAAVDGLGEETMIVFAPPNPKSTITVFTDVTCPYCAKLHNELGKLNAAGIKLRYLAFPRAGIGSPGYDQMVSVWCADDPQAAMTNAKLGKKIEPKQCDNPVKQHYQLGQLLGISGTPTIILDDGSVIGGYVPSKTLIDYTRNAGGG